MFPKRFDSMSLADDKIKDLRWPSLVNMEYKSMILLHSQCIKVVDSLPKTGFCSANHCQESSTATCNWLKGSVKELPLFSVKFTNVL